MRRWSSPKRRGSGGMRRSPEAAANTVGEPRQSMRCRRRRRRKGRVEQKPSTPSLKARNSASDIFAQAIANSRCARPSRGRDSRCRARRSGIGREKLAPVRQPPEGFGLGRAAVQNAMRASRNASPGRATAIAPGVGASGPSRPPRRQGRSDQSLGVESGNLDRRAGQNELLELDPRAHRGSIAPFRPDDQREDEQALLVVGQMVDSQARRVAKARARVLDVVGRHPEHSRPYRSVRARTEPSALIEPATSST